MTSFRLTEALGSGEIEIRSAAEALGAQGASALPAGGNAVLALAAREVEFVNARLALGEGQAEAGDAR